MRKQKRYELHQSALYHVTTKRRLASILRLSLKELEAVANSPNRYKEWDEPKQGGGARHIENPRPALKKVQSRIAALIGRIEPADYLYCPVKGRSYISNAKVHANGKEIRKLDIRRYFESTNSKRVYWFFNSVMKCSEDVAGILTKISTLNGRLPTGSPLSPILSFYAHLDMWEDIANLVGDEYSFSVYMDDLAVSGEKVSGELMWEIKKRIRKAGLDYHKERSYRGGKAVVTGIAIRDGQLGLPHAKHEKLYFLRKGIAQSADSEERIKLARSLQGAISQARQVQQVNAQKG